MKELYPLISSTVLALEDTDTLNDGTKKIKSWLTTNGLQNPCNLPENVIVVENWLAMMLVSSGIFIEQVNMTEIAPYVIGL